LASFGFTDKAGPGCVNTGLCAGEGCAYGSLVELSDIGKLLIVSGLALAVVGVLVLLASKGMLLRLPGNFSFESGGVRIYIPLATSLLLSIVLTIVLNLIVRR
jgi:hypothetical protein